MSADNSFCLPWAQTLIDEVMDITRTSVTNWCNIVAKTGLSETLRKEWSEIFVNQVTETYKEMTDEAVENQNKIINQIEILLKKSEILCKDLHIRMPQYGSQDLSLYEEFQLLEKRINEYEKMVQAQKKEIELLVKQQREACKLLGWKEKKIPTSPLPTKEYLEEFKRYLETLESTKFERWENFINTKNEIVNIVDELQYKPDLDFEKMVLSVDDDEFLITDDNMGKLEVFYGSLKELKENAKREVADLREVLENLWKILNVDSSVRDAFLEKYYGNSLNTLNALKSEIKRCEVLKKANIQTFVEKLRSDLAHLWDKCHVVDSERENFIYYRVDHYTEDLLTLHDYEIKRLENFYKNNIQLFTMIEKRKSLWEKMLRLEEKETASDRYKNRGGQLLQEERERKTLAKQIPSMEERMLELAAKYEEDNRTPFLSWGETIEAIINRDHEEHNQNRKLKLSERKKIRDNTLTPRSNLMVTSSKSTQNLALLTPRLLASKRKLMVTPSCSSKRSRILQEANARTAPPKLKINDKTIKTPRFSTERAKRNGKRRRLSQKSLKKKDSSPVSSEYYSFEREVDNKDGCRSTMGPETLAVPLPATPQPTPSNQHSPRMVSKFSVAAAPVKLLF